MLERRAGIAKALAHPHRLCIVAGLKKRRCSVGKIQENLQINQSCLSQHLSKLRAAGIIKGVRSGREIHYEVIDERAGKIADILTSGIIICREEKGKSR